MALESATACIFLAASFFLLPIFFFSHHVAAATAASLPLSFSFDFSDTSKYSLKDLRFEGDAALNGDLVDLTCNSDALFCVGRMSYNQPVRLYDNNTGEVASFSTTFTFDIDLFPNTTRKGDGMTFFLSGYPSSLPPGSASSVLGLTNDSKTVPSGADRFIAVEFDTYVNPWDPTASTDHIGINLNSMTSVSATRLPTYGLTGTMTATITFDNATRILEATVHFDASRSLPPASVKTQLPDNLDALLPPVVAVGFSAATGAYTELHQIHSWSFNSTMAATATEKDNGVSGHPIKATTAALASPPLSFSFDFSNTSKYRLGDLRFEGDAALNGDLVDLTCNSDTTYYCSGRMSYNHPVPFYNNYTGEVASFVTTFTFAIKLWPNTTKKGDGMTFFLSGYPSSLLPGSYSGALGLTNSTKITPTGADRFVAVEFDTWADVWDPTASDDHMGIDLSSLTSVSATRLPTYSLNGTMTATITFDNATRMLEATLHFANRSLASASVKMQLPEQLDALLPPVVAVGFSAATGGNSELNQILSWSFNSTMAAAETPTGFNRVQPEQDKIFGVKGRQGRALVIAGIVILVLALLLGIWLTLSCWRVKHKRGYFGKHSRLQRLAYNELSNATDKFSDANKLGEGNFGVVYRGTLRNKEVAVKKILQDSQGQCKDFIAELGTISGTGHKNVVSLEGWCCSVSNFMFWCLYKQDVQLFIVYELVPNGDLHRHLYDKTKVLSWAMRYKIVIGLCSALNYLHHQCRPYILHRDIKPSNILLDDEFNPKLGDFGLSRAAQRNDATSVPTQVAAGTMRYMDPLTMTDGEAILRRSSDVYSFGIVLLEIAHGEYDAALFRNLHTHRQETFVESFADKRLDCQFDKVQMERVIILGLRCSEQDASKRPSLDAETLRFLEKGGELRAGTIHQDEPHPATPAPAAAVAPA